ncbi:LrgB family protein, partial [Microvirga sp. 3-52]|nr:LrgB family protein [Microvirga sp. 3-52]
MLYLTMRYTYARFPIAVLHPVLTSTTIIILLLLVLNVSYDSYMVGGEWLEMFLGPSVVALAYPLYKQRIVVLKYRNAILLGVASGLLTAMGSILLFAKLFRFE